MPRMVCPHCLREIMVLVAPTGQLLHVDPVPGPGGPLLVNGLAGRVIGRVPPAGRKDVGWWPHQTVCSRQFPPPRPDRLPVTRLDDGRVVSVDWLRAGRPARAGR
jgi:hypothetical protein